jgi:phenylacetate-CoA ligase
MPESVDELTLINSTTGTTGDPTPYPFSLYDLDVLRGEMLSRGLWRAGARKRDRIIECFDLSMHIGGIATVMGLQKLGLTVIPVGAESGTDRIFQMSKHYKPTMFIGTPSLAGYLIDKAPEKIGADAKSLGIKLLLCGGEPGPGVPGIKHKIENGFNGKLIDHGAGFGVSCVYPEYQGIHSLMDDVIIYELIDPNTKEAIPLENGAQGEAVFTTLDCKGFLWVRQSMGDLQKVMTSPCPCGCSGFRYNVVGRTDGMLKVKGVMIYPTSVAGVVEGFVPRLTGEFRIVLTEKPPMVEPPLKIKIERGNNYDSPN